MELEREMQCKFWTMILVEFRLVKVHLTQSISSRMVRWQREELDKHIIQPVSHRLSTIVLQRREGFLSSAKCQLLFQIMPILTTMSSVCSSAGYLEFMLPPGQSQSHLRLIIMEERDHKVAGGQQGVKHHPLLQKWWTLRIILAFQAI